MNLERRVKRCNAILAAELRDLGRFEWKWSNEIEFVFQKLSDTGNPLYDYKADPESGLIQAVRDYERTRLVDINPAKRNLWVLCRWYEPSDFSPEQWEKQFGGLVPYAGNFVPCDPVWLPKGMEPTEELSWDVVHAYRRQRAKKTQELEEEMREEMAKREQERRTNLRDAIASDAPAFNGIPGQKGVQHYSFGGIKDTPLASETTKEIPCQQQ